MNKRSVFNILAVTAFGLALFVAHARADAITDWNAKAEAIHIQKQLPPAPSSREMAILHVVMFEAVNAIVGHYEPYLGTIVAPPWASPTL